MKSLKFFAATVLLCAAGVGVYKGAEVVEQASDRPDTTPMQTSVPSLAIAPAVTVEVQAEPTLELAAPGAAIPSPDGFQLLIESSPKQDSGELDFDLATPDLAQLGQPSAQRKSPRQRAVSPGLFSISTSNTFIVPMVLEGDRPTSTDIIRSFNITTINLSDAPPSTNVGVLDPIIEPTSLADSSTRPITDPLEIDLLKPTAPDPLSTAKSPDASVPEPGMVVGLLTIGALGVGAIAKRKLAKRYS